MGDGYTSGGDAEGQVIGKSSIPLMDCLVRHNVDFASDIALQRFHVTCADPKEVVLPRGVVSGNGDLHKKMDSLHNTCIASFLDSVSSYVEGVRNHLEENGTISLARALEIQRDINYAQAHIAALADSSMLDDAETRQEEIAALMQSLGNIVASKIPEEEDRQAFLCEVALPLEETQGFADYQVHYVDCTPVFAVADYSELSN